MSCSCAVDSPFFHQLAAHLDDQRHVLVADRADVHAGVAGRAAPATSAESLRPAEPARLPFRHRCRCRVWPPKTPGLREDELLEVDGRARAATARAAGDRRTGPFAATAFGTGVGAEQHPPGELAERRRRRLAASASTGGKVPLAGSSATKTANGAHSKCMCFE